MENFFNAIVWFSDNIIWSPALVVVLIISGVFFSLVTRFLQVRLFTHMIPLVFSRKKSAAGVSSFQAFSIALSGRIGVGNVAGVAAAIGFGGPGAVFWMWVMGFLGAATAYVESTLGQLYKVEYNGQYRGGPAFYLYHGTNLKFLGILFALVTIIAAGIFMPAIQANTIATSFSNAFNINKYITSAFIIIVMAIIIFGGLKRIASFADKVVPVMALLYLIAAIAILIININQLPSVISTIFSSAFGMHQVFGGIVGSAIMLGVKRGIYANEAGQGSGPHAASAAEVSHPSKQGLVQAASIYFDTFGICTATACIILMTGVYNVVDKATNTIIYAGKGIGNPGISFTQQAIDTLIPGFGNGFIAVIVLLFAFTTIMAYYYMTEVNIAFLTYIGLSEKYSKSIFNVMRVLFLIFMFYGATAAESRAWSMGDLGVGSMAWINLIGILLLYKPTIALLKDYEKQLKEGKEVVYNSSKLPFKGVIFWKNK